MEDDNLPPNLKASATKMITEANALVDAIRTAKLKEFDLIRKQLENDFKDFVLIASTVCKTDTSALVLIDDVYQHFKVMVGSSLPAYSPKDDSICANTTIQCAYELTVIPDTKLDLRIAHTSWVKNNTITFYAAAPLITFDGVVIGSLCVFDDKAPRDLDSTQRETLAALGRLIGSLLTKLK